MAPTEMLARQHADTLDRLLAGSHTRLGLLTGGQTAKARAGAAGRRSRRARSRSSIGTQAVVSSDVPFAQLGLVVIDEQHKFGVRQRAALKQSGRRPALPGDDRHADSAHGGMTLFGDLDVTTLARQSAGPANRAHLLAAATTIAQRWWDFFRKKLREGRQGYVDRAAGRGIGRRCRPPA